MKIYFWFYWTPSDGQAVASTSYNLYGARKTSTDTTGNPFAYNGEARDDTGLDYLRARNYDSQGGTFLTEDSYLGEAMGPLSQNRYSYVQLSNIFLQILEWFAQKIPFFMIAGNLWNRSM